MECKTNAPSDGHYMETTPVTDLMDMLGNTKGYKASALIVGTGGGLYSNAVDQVDKQNLSNYCRQANHSASDAGFYPCRELSDKVNNDFMVVLSSANNGAGENSSRGPDFSTSE